MELKTKQLIGRLNTLMNEKLINNQCEWLWEPLKKVLQKAKHEDVKLVYQYLKNNKDDMGMAIMFISNKHRAFNLERF